MEDLFAGQWTLITGASSGLGEEFARQLKADVATAEREGFMLCVCRVDLDQFKRVNAEFGVDVGDQILEQIAHRLEGERYGPGRRGNHPRHG